MRIAPSVTALSVVLWLHPSVSAAQMTLTLDQVLARARQEAPQIVGARLAVDEARARVVGAKLRSQTNPELDVSLGNRASPVARSTDLDVELSQLFEPSGRRGALLSSATAAVDRGTALLEETTRVVLREAGAVFHRAVHAQERIVLFTAAESLAVSVHQTADRRYRAGDIAVLDVNLARTALARVRADRAAAAADLRHATGQLRELLRLEGEIRVQGTLTAASAVDLTDLKNSTLRRPELRDLDAAIREAEADVSLGQSFGRPDVGFAIRYTREQSDQIVAGGLKLTLPLFNSGQQLRATGAARAARLRSELELTRARILTEVETALAVYNLRRDAIGLLERDALPGLDENDTLAARSFEVGQLGLADLLVIRRELLDTRFQYLDALLEVALARLDLDAAAGVLR